MHPAWVQSLRDQCKAAKTPFLFKQWGEWKSISQLDDIEIAPLYRSPHKAKPHQDQEVIDDLYGKTCKVATSCLQLGGNHSAPDELGSWGTGAMLAFKVGKKPAGRVLDCSGWTQSPEALS